MQNNEKSGDTSKMIATLITELDKPNGLYTWLMMFGEHHSLARYVTLSRTFCQDKRSLPDIMPSVVNKLVETQEKLDSLHLLWCCFWNTYERIQDDNLWQDSVERHPMLAHLNSNMKPGLRFASTAWKIVVKIRSTNPTLDPWVLSLAAFSLLLKAMKSHSASFQQWALLCSDRFRGSIDAYLVGKLYQSNSRFWECPLDPPSGIAAEVITSLVLGVETAQVPASKKSNAASKSSALADNIIMWLQTQEIITENLNPMILMTEYVKYLDERKGLNPFVFLGQPADDLLPEQPSTDAPAVATDTSESEEHSPSDDEAKEDDDDLMYIDDARKQKMIESLIMDVTKPNGLHTWLLRFDENNSLARFVALTRTYCREERPNTLPSVRQKLDATQEKLDSLYHLWCCFWNTYERIEDDILWKGGIQRHPFLTRLDKNTKADMKFIAIAWKVVIKIRSNNSTLNPWVMSLVAFSLLLKAMKSHPASFQPWEVLCSTRFRESVDEYLLGKLYQSSKRCQEFPLDPPPSFTADAVASLMTIIVTTQVLVNNKNATEPPLSESFLKWFQRYENSAENLNPVILMTEYVRFIEKGKGLNPFVFLAKPAGMPDDTISSKKASTGTDNPPSQPAVPVAQALEEPMETEPIEASTSVPAGASDPPAPRETTPSRDSHETPLKNVESPPRNDSTSNQASPLPQSESQTQDNNSDEGSAQDVPFNLNDDSGDDASVKPNDENSNLNDSQLKRPANDLEQKSPEQKKQKVNQDDSKSQRLATAMALVVKELNIINQELPDSSSRPHSLSDSMELTEWTVSLLVVDHVAPSNKLSRYLNDASLPQHWTKELIPTLNRTLLRFSQENLIDKATRTAPVSVTKSEGVVQIHGNVTDDKLLSKAVILLYYHALEAILTSESERLKVTSHPQIVLYSVFHKALLACCMWCVTKAIGVAQKLRASPCLQALSIQSTLRVCDSNPYDFLKVSESFVRVLCLGRSDLRLGSPLPQKLPRLLHRDLQSMEVIILDSLLWSTSILNGTAGSLPEQIEDFMSKTNDDVTLWPVETLAPTLREEVSQSEDVTYPTPEHDDFAEYRCVNFLIRSVVKLSFSRFEDICGLLKVPVEYPVVTHAWVCFRHLLRHHVDLLFDRHMDQWILCCLYGVAKALSYPLTFSQIIEAYIKSRGPVVGDVTCQHILRYIRMDNTSHDLTTGDIIALYNHVWVPTMRPYLLESDSLKESAKKVEELLDMKEQMMVTSSGVE